VHAGDPARSIEEIASTCRVAPQAATTLVQLLRLRSQLRVADALVAESIAYSMLLAGTEFNAWLQQQDLPAARPSPDPVEVTDDGTTLTITLNRPEVRNAYNAAMRDQLVNVLRGLLAGPTHPPTLLMGKGPSFSSGGDLAEFGTSPDPVTAHAIRISRSPGLLLDALGDVTAQVHGPCVGAGVELPAFCRRVVARPDSTFRLPELRMGLLPGAGGTASLPQRIGRQRTAFLALSADALPVKAALGWGLVDEVVDDA
jgi:enoyl-CoA hydratase/carnithine racemase